MSLVIATESKVAHDEGKQYRRVQAVHGFSRIDGYHNKIQITDDRTLTAREREVLRLVAQGKGNREIANYLGISLRTVKVHMANIFEKLGVNRRIDAVAALRPGSPWMDARAS